MFFYLEVKLKKYQNRIDLTEATLFFRCVQLSFTTVVVCLNLIKIKSLHFDAILFKFSIKSSPQDFCSLNISASSKLLLKVTLPDWADVDAKLVLLWFRVLSGLKLVVVLERKLSRLSRSYAKVSDCILPG